MGITNKTIVGIAIPIVIVIIMVPLMLMSWNKIQVATEAKNDAATQVRSSAYRLVEACLNEPSAFCDEQMIKMGKDCIDNKFEFCNEEVFRNKLIAYYEMRNFPKATNSDEMGIVPPQEACIEVSPGVCVPPSMIGGDT